MPQTSNRLILPYGYKSTYTRSDMTGEQVHQIDSGQMKSSLMDVKQVNDVPDWKLKIVKRQDATGSYFRRAISSNIPNMVISSTGRSKSGNFSFKTNCFNRDTIDPTSYVDESTDPVLRDQALTRLKNRINGRSSQINSLIPLVELRELRATIKSVAYASVDIMKALIEIKRSKGKSAYKYASHAWLTWSFGISPTIAEANSIIESIDAFIMRSTSEAVRDSGSATKKWITSTNVGTATPYGATAAWNVRCVHELGYRFTCGYIPALKPGNNYNVGEHFGLNFGSMVPALWELTPFSWVFDYFSTMGAFLEDTFVSSSTNTFFVSETRRYSCNGVTSYRLTPSTAFDQFVERSGRGQTFQVVTLWRTNQPSLPRRSLRFNTLKEISGVGPEGIESFSDVEKAIKRVLNLGSVLVGGKAFSNRID